MHHLDGQRPDRRHGRGERTDVQILVVEDEPKLAEAIRDGLSAEGYVVTVAGSGEVALQQLTALPFGLVVLDLGLPGCDGMEVLEAIRARPLDVPVLIVSARDTAAHRIRGLDSGADDYLTKPFELAELVARIRAISRRGDSRQPLHFHIGDLSMDLVSRSVTRGGVAIELTNREFQILECLFRHLPHPVSRGILARDVWKGMERATPLDNVIDVHMARLRQKLGEGEGPPLIHTVRGVGFVLAERDA
ncbi:MAG: response regulator transcription factor [Myxococcales bacterium]